MTYTTKLVQQADTYSRLSTVTAQVQARFDSQSFATSTNCARTNARYYFTYEGRPTHSTSAYFQCDVTNANLPAWPLPHVMQIQMNICWPKPQFTSTNVIILSTLDYD